MADHPIDPHSNDRSQLSLDWKFAADIAAHNLGFDDALPTISAEHWQLVLTSVETRMKMRGIEPPLGWKEALARMVGRHGA